VSKAPVSVEMVVETLNKNTQIAQAAVTKLLERLDPARHCNCSNSLAGALITQPDKIPAATLSKLEPLVKKYLGD
jgi:5'-methylthioadenosine phosphorylase